MVSEEGSSFLQRLSVLARRLRFHSSGSVAIS